MNKIIIKETFNTIKKNLKKFIFIVSIVLLGVAFFVGMKSTTPDMKNTLDAYYKDTNFLDIRVLSTMGISKDDISTIEENTPDIERIEGGYSGAFIAHAKESDIVVRILSYNNDDTAINKAKLTSGRLPKSNNECVVEKNFLLIEHYSIGDTITINDPDNFLTEKELTIVGTVESPFYIVLANSSRGTTNLLSGKVSYYIYVNEKNISSEVYSDVYVKFKNTSSTFSNTYNNYINDIIDNIELIAIDLSTQKYEELINKYKNEIEVKRQELLGKKEDYEIEYSRNETIADEYRQKIEELQTNIPEDSKINEEIKPIKEALSKAKNEIDNQKKNIEVLNNDVSILNNDILNIENTIEKYENLIKDNESIIENNQVQINNKKTENINFQNSLDTYISTISLLKSETATIQSEIDTLNKEKEKLLRRLQTTSVKNRLAEIEILLNEKNTSYKNKISELGSLEAAYSNINNAIQSNNDTIKELENRNTNYKNKINQIKTNITVSYNNIKLKEKEIENLQETILLAEKEYTSNLKKYTDAENQFNSEKDRIYSDLSEAEKELEDNKTKLDEVTKKMSDAKNQYEIEYEKYEKELVDAFDFLDDIQSSNWSITGRTTDSGYKQFSEDIEIVTNISKIFPVVFFIVVTLVTFTTISRMIEEERKQVGTLKAIGYSKGQIIIKYMIYSILSTTIGSILGAIVGTYIIPKVLYKAYSIMYSIPDLKVSFSLKYSIIGLLISLFCTIVASYLSCNNQLKESPSALMRSKSQKIGKKTLFEYIPFIWNKLSFNKKITIRNLFLYKKRLIMTIVGVIGCMALIIASFGLKSSISNMIPTQYGEILKPEFQAFLKDSISRADAEEELIRIKQLPNIKYATLLNMQMATINDNNDNNTNYDVYMIIPKTTSDLDNFITLKNRVTNEKYTLKDDGVIISEKLANILNVSIGDKINFKDSNDNSYEAIISNITENYIDHYIYMSSNYYSKINQTTDKATIKYNTIVGITNDKNYNEEELSKEITLLDRFSYIQFVSLSKIYYENTVKNLNYIVIVLAVAAGLLAYVVLSILANINISERKKEIATLKVLGFRENEVNKYIKSEMNILTIIGIILGMPAGMLLTKLVIKETELYSMMFNYTINKSTYLYASIITLAFYIIVNFRVKIMLKKVNMVESLKQVE